MRTYKVNRVQHTVFDELDEVPKNIKFKPDWRDGQLGDWVLADDGCVIQVIRKGNMIQRNKTREYIGTCTGTFPIGPQVKLDTSKRANIYSFGGNKSPENILLNRTSINKRESLFVQYLLSGLRPEQAYLQAYPTNNIGYAKEKSAQLVKTERIRTAMKEELKPVLEELGVNEEYILKGIKNEAELADKADTRLKALFKLSDIMDLEDKNQTTVTQISGAVFKGFTEDMVEAAERPKEVTDGR
tara:strand:+ start:1745 stop:2473 length:729 start_codon:yes stop_codon:yes gene_type:complete